MSNASLNIQAPGYNPVATRLSQPLTATQNFNVCQLVGVVSSTGGISPLNTATVGGIAFAVGMLDQSSLGAVPASGIFASVANQVAAVVSGSFQMVNGTSGNAFSEESIGADAYTADGVTANATSSSNPTNAVTGLPSGTATGVVCGIVTAFSSTLGVTVTCLPELNSMLTSSGDFTGALAVAHGGTGSATAAGARTNLTAAESGVATGSATPSLTGSTTPSFTQPTITPTYAASPTATTGATVSWGGASSAVATQSAGGIVAAAHALAGGFVDDGTSTALILDNTACTATSGTITVSAGLKLLPVPTGLTITIQPPPGRAATASGGACGAHTHTSAAHTHTQS